MTDSQVEAISVTDRTKRILGIGEAMIELSPAGVGLYRLGFAGDTFNTVWHMSQLPGDRGATGFSPELARMRSLDVFLRR